MPRRTIVITGSSDGVGAAAARRLAAAGDNVVVIGRSVSKTKAIADELGADYICADFSDLAQVRALADGASAAIPANRRAGQQRRKRVRRRWPHR